MPEETISAKLNRILKGDYYSEASAQIGEAFDLAVLRAEAKRKRRRVKCAHCGRPAATLCDWKVMKPRPTKVCRLRPGMRVRFFHILKGELVSTTLSKIDTLPASRAQFFPKADAQRVLTFNTDPIQRRVMHVAATIEVYIVRTCSKACCAHCRRSPGPGRHYCQDHWAEDAPAAAI